MEVCSACPAVVLILLLSASVSGQPITQQRANEENTSDKVINPIASLMRLTVENRYSPSLWDSHGEENELEIQAAIPFQAFAKQNLARIKVFFETSSPDGNHGLSESEIFDVLLFPHSWGTFAAGLTARLSSQTSSSLGALSPGPAVGAVMKHGKWKYGLFNQNFLSDTFAQTQLQPILAYAFNRKWSADMGDAQYTYDWKKGRVTEIPLSGQLNRILPREKEDIHLFFKAQYNAKNDSGSDKWTLQIGVSLIPKQ